MDKTLLKGLMVLEAVTDADRPPRSVDEIAAMVGLTRSNTHRTLQTLVHAGYLMRDERVGGYTGTIRLFERGMRLLERLDIRRQAAPLMKALADKTGETVHLSMLDGIDVVYIEKIDSPQPIRAYSVVGGRAPAYAVATGKALLAHQPVSYVERYESMLVPHTEATLSSLKILQADFEQSRRRGYAINRGEWRDGVGGVACIVRDSQAGPLAAVDVSGPLDRLTPAQMRRFAPEVVHCATEISRSMGYRDRPSGPSR